MRLQCTSTIEVWGYEAGGSVTCCQGRGGHPGFHYTDWCEAQLAWDYNPQCGAWNPEREGESHRTCLDRKGHEGMHWSYRPKGLKVAWAEDARTMAHNLARELMEPSWEERAQWGFHRERLRAQGRTHEKLYIPTEADYAEWELEGRIQDALLREPPQRSQAIALGAPRTYQERKARRKGQ